MLSLPYRLDSMAERKCPWCAEQIQDEAVICRWYGDATTSAPSGYESGL